MEDLATRVAVSMEDLPVSMEDLPVSMEEKKTFAQNPLWQWQWQWQWRWPPTRANNGQADQQDTFKGILVDPLQCLGPLF